MNQLHRPARLMRDDTDLDRDGEGMSPSALLAVEYDDGNPATIAPARPRPAAAPMRRADTAIPATPLADIPRDAAIDYDDGDPATVLC